MLNASGLSGHITSPQMRLPTQPRLPETLIKIWHNQRTLVLLGAMSDVVLRGKAAGSLMPRLLPLLNGNLGVDEIIARLPEIAPKTVVDALMLLQMQGVLEEGAGPRLDQSLARDFAGQLRFYSRYVDYTRAQRSRNAVLERLQASSVLLIGRGAGAAQVASELASLGVGRIEVVALPGDATDWTALATPHTTVELSAIAPADLADTPEAAPDLSGQRLILLVVEGAETALTRSLNRLALRAGAPFLRSRLDPAGPIEIGPTVFGGETACYDCLYAAGLLDPDAQTPPTSESGDTAWSAPAEVLLGASQTALFALAVLTSLLPIASGHAIHRFDAASLRFEQYAAARLLGCRTCSPIGAYDAPRDLPIGPAHSENFAAFYHANSLDRNYAQFPKSYQDHYSSQNAQSMFGGFKSYTNRERIDLRPLLAAAPAAFERPYGERPDPAIGNQPSLAALAQLLALAASRRDTSGNFDSAGARRLAPSGGNFASQTLYLVNLGLPDLAPGVYHFNPHTIELEPVADGDQRATLAAALPDGNAVDGAQAAIIQTAAFGRLDAKYPLKGYQYALYDSGAMLQSLQTVGGLLGLRVAAELDFYDDRINGLLRLHNPLELPVYAALISGAASPEREDNDEPAELL